MVVPSTHSVAEIYPLRNLLAAISGMSEKSLRVAEYILENPQLVASMSIGELAEATSSNKSLVVRVCKLSGYRGYRELRAALIENRGILRGADLIGLEFPSSGGGDGGLLSLAREMVKMNAEVLQDSLALLDEITLRRAIDKVLASKRVLLAGFGSSGPVVLDAHQRFVKLQIPSAVCSDARLLTRIVGNMGIEETLFCISYTGASQQIVEALETAKRRRTPRIVLTSTPGSAAANLSDIVLVSAVQRHPGGAENVAARIAQFVVIDIICAAMSLQKKSTPA
jgi:DNA-binding MurR/RpiR family transcriptional regulator